MPQERSDSLLSLTKNRDTLIPRTSEQNAFSLTVEEGQSYFTTENLVWMETALVLHAKNIQSHVILNNRDYKQL